MCLSQWAVLPFLMLSPKSHAGYSKIIQPKLAPVLLETDRCCAVSLIHGSSLLHTQHAERLIWVVLLFGLQQGMQISSRECGKDGISGFASLISSFPEEEQVLRLSCAYVNLGQGGFGRPCLRLRSLEKQRRGQILKRV